MKYRSSTFLPKCSLDVPATCLANSCTIWDFYGTSKLQTSKFREELQCCFCFLLGCKWMVLMIPNGASSSIDAYTNIHVYLSIYVYNIKIYIYICMRIYIYIILPRDHISYPIKTYETLDHQDLVKKKVIPSIFHIMKKL